MKYYPYPKTDPIKDYIPIPKQITRLGLNSGEIAVYTCLMDLENRITYQCYPSYKTIGKAIGMSVNTVRKYVDSLVEKKLITVEPTKVRLKNGKTRNGNLLYTIRPIGEAQGHFYAEQLKKAEREKARHEIEQKLKEYDRKHPKSSGLMPSSKEAG